MIVSAFHPFLVHLQHLKIRIQLLRGIVRHFLGRSRSSKIRTDVRLCGAVDYSKLYTPRWRWMGWIDNERDCKYLRQLTCEIGINRSTLPPGNSSNSGGSSEMARRDIIPLLVFSMKTPQWRISVISKNSDKSYVPCCSV